MPEWHEDSECGKAPNRKFVKDFFSNKSAQQQRALKLCSVCPVRQHCLKDALEEKVLWGIWGGLTYKKLRRTLSINWQGQEMRHKRPPLCPFCSAKTTSLITKTVSRPNGGRWATMKLVECLDCNFSWQSRTSANAVEAFHFNKNKKKPSSIEPLDKTLD
jgi:hypothetical protein